MSTERCISPCLDAGPSLRLLDGGRKGSMTDSIEQDLAQERAWLYQITLNVARNRARGKKPSTESLNGEASERHADPTEGPHEQLEASRRRADLATLVAGLPSRYRAPLILRYVEGLKLEEVAQILKQPLGTTKSNVHRAINALREAITQSRREMRWNHA